MTITEILHAARTVGAWLEARGDCLHVEAPRGALTPNLRTVLVTRKPDLLAVLWRLQEMRRLEIEAPQPVACARESARGGPGHCFSCGDPLDLPFAYGRCAPCDIAADLFYAARPSEDVEVLA